MIRSSRRLTASDARHGKRTQPARDARDDRWRDREANPGDAARPAVDPRYGTVRDEVERDRLRACVGIEERQPVERSRRRRPELASAAQTLEDRPSVVASMLLDDATA